MLRGERNLVLATRRSHTRIVCLKKRDDIKHVLSSKRFNTDLISVRYCVNDCNINRFVIIPEKKSRKAVSRNLIRRRISEILRTNQFKLVNGFDIAFFIKREVLEISYVELEEKVLRILNTIKVIKDTTLDNE